jgi:hypothetical protein
MPVGQKDHQGVAMPMAVILRRIDQLLDLILRQVLPGPNLNTYAAVVAASAFRVAGSFGKCPDTASMQRLRASLSDDT